MIPINQSNFDPKTGDCFPACVASILDFPLKFVPVFCQHEDWYERFHSWCYDIGLRVMYSDDIDDIPSIGYSIVSGGSPRFPGKGHAVVYEGKKMVHDPHHLDPRGIEGFWDVICIYRRDEPCCRRCGHGLQQVDEGEGPSDFVCCGCGVEIWYDGKPRNDI